MVFLNAIFATVVLWLVVWLMRALAQRNTWALKAGDLRIEAQEWRERCDDLQASYDGEFAAHGETKRECDSLRDRLTLIQDMAAGEGESDFSKVEL